MNKFMDTNTHMNDINMDTAKGLSIGIPDIRMATAKALTLSEDIRMETARAGTTIRQGHFQPWEKEHFDSPEVKRKATVAQLCELYLFYCLRHYEHVMHLCCDMALWPTCFNAAKPRLCASYILIVD